MGRQLLRLERLLPGDILFFFCHAISICTIDAFHLWIEMLVVVMMLLFEGHRAAAPAPVAAPRERPSPLVRTID